jgi:ABC-2 type transport system permease protein
MRFSRSAAIVLRQYYLVRGGFTRVFQMFVWVAIDIVLWGFISRYLTMVAPSGPDFVPTLLGAVVLWNFFTRVMQGVTMAFFEDVWARNFLNMFASPITIYEYLAGLVVSSIVTSTVGLLAMLVVATLVFGLSAAAYGLAVLPFLLVLFLFGIALGIVGCSLVLRLGPAAEWFVWPIPAIISPFVGVFYPVETLPTWMQVIGRALPPTYVFEGVREVVAGGGVSYGSLGIGAALALVSILLASWLFARVFRYAVRGGLIARYSAESVS